MKQQLNKQQGFTLIELSIVLVIIGLIVGGVLVGRDMIKAAQIRATVGQWEKYNSAVNTFRTKYNGLPGDLAGAASFGFTAATVGTGVVAGNGLIEATDGVAEESDSIIGFETGLFWRDLSAANLIEVALTLAPAGAVPDLAAADMPNYFPAAKLGRGNYFLVFNSSGLNYYQVTGITATTTGAPTLATVLTPLEAFNIDAKIDDGSPGVGVARAMLDVAALNVAADYVGADTCVASATAYQTDTTAEANALACQLRMRFN